MFKKEKMIQHVVQKKRVIVMDCDITIGEDVWKKIMRHVLGRHFVDLQGKGPGWSFSHTHLDTFSDMVDKHLSSGEKETTSTFSDEKSTQTSMDDGEEPQSSDEHVQNSCSSTDEETTQTDVGEEDVSSDDDKSFQNNDTQTDENLLERKYVQNNETQTCPKILFETTTNHGKHVYKFDVDDNVRLFVDYWRQKVE